jgi:argininosuccinate lyase
MHSLSVLSCAGALELMRGRAGRVNGLLMAGFTMMKGAPPASPSPGPALLLTLFASLSCARVINTGLPSGYNRDFHEDKEIMVKPFSTSTHWLSLRLLGPSVHPVWG